MHLARLGMPDPMERTALLIDNDHTDSYDETEGDVSKPTPTHAHFKLPIKILTISVSVLSIAIFVLLIASYVLLSVGPFQYTYSSQKGIRDLAICVRNLLFHCFSSVPPLIFLIINCYLLTSFLAIRKLYSFDPDALRLYPGSRQHGHQHSNVHCYLCLFSRDLWIQLAKFNVLPKMGHLSGRYRASAS